MNIKFLKAEREWEHQVKVTYSLDGVEFAVHWLNESEDEFDNYCLQDSVHDVVSKDEELRERVHNAIQMGENDDNPDEALYLFIRDEFHAGQCEEI